MLRIICMSLCMAVILLCSHGMAQCADLNVKGKQVFLAQEGKNILLENESVEPVANSDMTFVCITNDREEGGVAVLAGTYLFDKAGKQIKSMINKDYKDFDPSMVGQASLSPDGKTLALDNSTSSVYIWFFLDYASFTVMGSADLVMGDGLTWVDNQRVLVNYVTGSSDKRSPCGVESCENIVNVGLVDIKNSQCKPLFPEDPLCNVSLERYADGVVYAVQGCKTEKDWKSEEGYLIEPTKRNITVKL